MLSMQAVTFSKNGHVVQIYECPAFKSLDAYVVCLVGVGSIVSLRFQGSSAVPPREPALQLPSQTRTHTHKPSPQERKKKKEQDHSSARRKHRRILRRVTVIWDVWFTKRDDELELKEGDIIDVYEERDEYWYGKNRRTHKIGVFSRYYVATD